MKYLFTIIIITSAFVSLQSQTFVKYDALGNNDGTSWQDAYTNLQVALEQAVSGDQIWVAAGTYVPNGPTPDSSHFVISEAIGLYGGFAGTEATLEERDFETNFTILSGDINGDDTPGDFELNRVDNAHHMVIVQASHGIPIIDGLTLIGGTTRLVDPDYNNIDPWEGGAIYATSQLILKNCIFRDNNGWRGAALDVSFPDSIVSNVLLENCLFDSNLATQGVVRLTNLYNSSIKNSIFQNNEAIDFGGGLVIGNSNMIVEDCLFDNNSSLNWAGSIAIFHNSGSILDSSYVHFKRSVFVENSALSFGGAVALQNFIPKIEFVVDSCEFSNNSTPEAASAGGGAIRVYCFKSSSEDVNPSVLFRVSNTDFTGNTSRFGGGVCCLSYDPLTIDASNTNFIGNAASIAGGGLYISHYDDSRTFTRLKGVSFNGNECNRIGGGIFFGSFDNLNRMQYEIDSCSFKNNVAIETGGAISSEGINGNITKSEFIENIAFESSGALESGNDSLVINNSNWFGNYTRGTLQDYNGGGAIQFWGSSVISINNNHFFENISDEEGSAIFISDNSEVKIENTLINNHLGNSTILNKANLNLLNTTMVDNELAIFQFGDAYAEIQNTIFQSNGINYFGFGNHDVESKGGNISNDDSMVDLLNGYADFKDLHETNPELDKNFVPLKGSPCIDNGNPDDNLSDMDLAGNDRIQGNQIDIGCYESAFTTTVIDARWNAPEVKVFPNPVKSTMQFEIKDDVTGMLTVSIYDFQGRQVYDSRQHKTYELQLFQESVSHLANGEYVLLISSTYKTYASNIIIHH